MDKLLVLQEFRFKSFWARHNRKNSDSSCFCQDAVLLLQDVYAENPEIIGQTNSPVKYSSLDGKEYEIKYQ